jgi:hypothetical protein
LFIFVKFTSFVIVFVSLNSNSNNLLLVILESSLVSTY